MPQVFSSRYLSGMTTRPFFNDQRGHGKATGRPIPASLRVASGSVRMLCVVTAARHCRKGVWRLCIGEVTAARRHVSLD